MTAAEKLLRRLSQARSLEAEVEALKAEIQAEKKRKRGKRSPSPQAVRREERKERAPEIRAAVMARADGKCEWCGREGFVLEWAHVIDGNGFKRQHEDVTTTAAACADCHHRGWHGSGPRRMQTLRDAKAWALRLGFREALAEIERKIAKAEVVTCRPR